MSIKQNPSKCYDNVNGECTYDPFPAKIVRLPNGVDVSSKLNTIDNDLCENIACNKKSTKVSGRYSREFEREIKSKER